jgi:putative sigma-54 modulation protein
VRVEITISHRNVEVPSPLRAAVDEKVGHLDRYLDAIERAEVRFCEEPHRRLSEREVCEVTLVGRGSGNVLRARAMASDAMAALDTVMDKLQRQLERRKGVLVGRSHPRRRVIATP